MDAGVFLQHALSAHICNFAIAFTAQNMDQAAEEGGGPTSCHWKNGDLD